MLLIQHCPILQFTKQQLPGMNLLPLWCAGKVAASGQEQMGQVQITEAFQNPDLLQNCLGFLRKYASDMGAHAACAVVPKQAIAYPQVCHNLAGDMYHACCPHRQGVLMERYVISLVVAW